MLLYYIYIKALDFLQLVARRTYPLAYTEPFPSHITYVTLLMQGMYPRAYGEPFPSHINLSYCVNARNVPT